jgi:hypothetical protein
MRYNEEKTPSLRMDFGERLKPIRERTTPVADTPILPPKTKHQRQSELRMIWRNKGVEGVQSIFMEKCSPDGKPPAAAMAPAEMIQAILDQEFPKPPPTPSEERIAKAIQDSLVLCRRSSAPLATLEKFSDELRATSEGWTDKEISAVEDGVRKGLNNKFHRT